MPKKLLLSILAPLGVSVLITGCGQKGPLYLPQAPAEPAPSITTGPPVTVPTSSTTVESSGPAVEPASEQRETDEYPEEQDPQK